MLRPLGAATLLAAGCNDVAVKQVEQEHIWQENCLARAPEGGSVGCWEPLTADDMHPLCADEGWNLEFGVRWADGIGPPAGLAFLPSCELSDDKRADCPELP